jgi:hypothetical protein
MAGRDLISKQTRIAFREHLVGWTLRTIGDLFDAADVPRGQAPQGISGERRFYVEEYYAGVDWTQHRDVKKILRAYEDVLSGLATDSTATDQFRKDYATKQSQKLTNLLRRDGFTYADGRLVATTEVDLRSIEDASQLIDRTSLRDHIRRIGQGVDSDPAQAIGSAKELVETVGKLVLRHYGKDVEAYDTLQRLIKEALKCLDLSLEDLPENKKGAESIRQVLAALAQIVGATAELRNLYGTGHGRVRSGGLQPRHARLVVGAAATLSRFMLETLDERRKPREE